MCAIVLLVTAAALVAQTEPRPQIQVVVKEDGGTAAGSDRLELATVGRKPVVPEGSAVIDRR
jgi:hypothetical protein